MATKGFRTSYGELFNHYLEERIQQGGAVNEVLNYVDLFRTVDPGARQEEFRRWAAQSVFPCGRCGYPFVPRVDEVEENDHALCFSCSL